jgi:hypothetical protein
MTMTSRKQPRDQLLRCLNCFTRMDIPLNVERCTCPKCKIEYEIAWRAGQAKILGLAESAYNREDV